MIKPYTITTITAILVSILSFYVVGHPSTITSIVVATCMLPVSILIDKHDEVRDK